MSCHSPIASEWTEKERSDADHSLDQLRVGGDFIEKVTKYGVTLNASAIAVCFANLGAGWEKPGLVTSISQFLPVFCVLFVLSLFAYLSGVIAQDSVAALRFEKEKNGYSAEAYNFFRGAKWAQKTWISLLSLSVFGLAIVVTWAGRVALENNYSDDSKLLVTGDFRSGFGASFNAEPSVSITVVNEGGRIGNIDEVYLRVGPINSDPNSFASYLMKLEFLNVDERFVKSGDQRRVSLRIPFAEWRFPEVTEFANKVASLPLGDLSSKINCSLVLTAKNFKSGVRQIAAPIECLLVLGWAKQHLQAKNIK